MKRLLFILLVILASCAAPKVQTPPLPPNMSPRKARQTTRVMGVNEGHQFYQASQQKSFYLTWSNEWTWCANLVEYRTNPTDEWRQYAFFTNAYTNIVYLKLDMTNQQCFFRVACVYYGIAISTNPP